MKPPLEYVNCPYNEKSGEILLPENLKTLYDSTSNNFTPIL